MLIKFSKSFLALQHVQLEYRKKKEKKKKIDKERGKIFLTVSFPTTTHSFLLVPHPLINVLLFTLLTFLSLGFIRTHFQLKDNAHQTHTQTIIKNRRTKTRNENQPRELVGFKEWLHTSRPFTNNGSTTGDAFLFLFFLLHNFQQPLKVDGYRMRLP